MHQFIDWFNAQPPDEKFEYYVVGAVFLSIGIAYILNMIL